MEQLYNKKYVYFEWDDELEGKEGFFNDSINTLKEIVEDNRTSHHGKIIKNSDPNCPYPFKIKNDSGYCNSAYKFCYYDPDYEVKKAFMDGETIQARFKSDDGHYCEWFDINKDTFSEGYSLEDFDLRLKGEYKVYVKICNNAPIFNITSSDCDTHCYFVGTFDKCHKYCEERKDYPEMMYAWEHGKTIQCNSGNGWEDCCDYKLTWDATSEYRIKDESKKYVPFDTVQELIDYWDEKHPSNRPADTLPLIWIKDKNNNRKYLITEFYFDKYFDMDVSTSQCELSLKDLFEKYTFLCGATIGKVKE